MQGTNIFFIILHVMHIFMHGCILYIYTIYFFKYFIGYKPHMYKILSRFLLQTIDLKWTSKG